LPLLVGTGVRRLIFQLFIYMASTLEMFYPERKHSLPVTHLEPYPLPTINLLVQIKIKSQRLNHCEKIERSPRLEYKAT